MGAVRRGEGIHHEDVAERREIPCQARVVGGLTGLEAQVLEQRHLAGFDGNTGAPPLDQPYWATEPCGERIGDRGKRQVRVPLARARSPQVRGEKHGRPLG